MNARDGAAESPLSPGFSNRGEHADEDHGGDYSTRMEELFDGDEEAHAGDEDDEFVYDGVDADQVTGSNYREQLRDVLGSDDALDVSEEEEIERSLLNVDFTENLGDPDGEELSKHAQISPESPSPTQGPLAVPPPEPLLTPLQLSSAPSESLLPSVSRLRSFASKGLRSDYNLSANIPVAVNVTSPSSLLSDISGSSTPGPGKRVSRKTEREVFRWTVLHSVSSQLHKKPSKAAIVLGASNSGSPTVLAANGLICVGTDAGRIFVFDFKQTLLGVCGDDTSASAVGPVSAIALSHDQTCLTSGHASGYIQIFDLKSPQVPVRIVAPPSPQAIMSGRQEGHLRGSRIVNVSFVAGRHTAIVSADENGLAFYHSLGKVLFVEASDTIRILGNYPPNHEGTTTLYAKSFHRRKPRSTLLAMATLPLGTVAHPTDKYQITALLTITKLVVVGLKPSPKTWLKRARADDAEMTLGRRRGTLAWFPSISVSQGSKDTSNDKIHPTLAYSWGRTVHLLRVSETMTKHRALNPRTGKAREVDMGTLVFEDVGTWRVDDTVLAMQWLNANQLLAFAAAMLSVYDTRTSELIEYVPFNASTLVSLSPGPMTDGSMPYSESLGDVAHSVRVYKGKIFLLCREEFQAGTMLTWADKILSLVEQGEFLSAIELTRSYYTGEAPGNRNGLPDDIQEQKAVLGQRLRELMAASANYAFSEDRMTDGTHSSPDGRGVDRTPLFEGLVICCTRSCIALGDYDFLFEDLFQHFEDAGITRIYLEQLEAFVLENTIHFVPPRITQRLVALHDDSGQPALAERVIWHIDPSCLDINQAIRLCQTHQLWDALIYVYTRALQDYVAPIVELISLIRQLQGLSGGQWIPNAVGVQRTTSSFRHVYKVFPYLVNVLSGQAYPSGEPLLPDEADRAKGDVYAFIFSGTSAIWPSEGGHLILTGSGAEPTYPYAQLLLRFDAELFLHSLDIAFEDSFLTDSPNITRLSIVKILLDIASCKDLPHSAATFINIFIARNIPKYPQYIRTGDLDSRVLHDLLVSLACSSDSGTREDRQLAVEYLLSAYTPSNSSEIEKMFESAGFYRILQSRRRHERQWTQLLSSYLLDPALQTTSLLPHVEEVLDLSRSDNCGVLPQDIQRAFSEALGHLLALDLQSTVALVDKFAPSLHGTALNSMDPSDDRQRYDYLLYLFSLQESDREGTSSPYSSDHPDSSEPFRLLFIKLRCRYMPSGVIDALRRMRSVLDWPAVEQICEESYAYGAVLWALNQRAQPRDALKKAEEFEKQLTQKVVRAIVDLDSDTDIDESVHALREIGQRGTRICLEHSSMSATTAVPLEDIWFQLLSSQLHSVQAVSSLLVADGTGSHQLKTATLSSLRDLVQNTFASLVTISSTRAVSFPRLFKRLVDPQVYAGSTSGTPYTEFRTILTGMLESYRNDGDMLSISQKLLDRDVFDVVEEYTKEKMRGRLVQHRCSRCHQTLLLQDGPGGTQRTDTSIITTRAAAYHASCQH